MRTALLGTCLALGCWLLAASPAAAATSAPPPDAAVVAGAPSGATAPGPAAAPDAPPAPLSAAGSRDAAPPGPAFPGLPSPGDLLPDLDPREWAEALVAALTSVVGEALLGAARTVVDWALGLGGSSLNFVTRTPEAGTYESTTVRSLWSLSRGIALSALAVVVMWGGFNLIVRRHLGSPYHDIMELLPRVVLAALALHLSLDFSALLIDLNNALASAVGGGGLPGYEQASAAQSGVGHVVMALGYAVVALLLVLQMLMRLALVDLLIVLGPLMVLCWVLPQTQGWTRWWAQLLPLAVFQQAVQVAVLRLGSSLMVELTPGRTADALVTLFLGIGVLWLTLRVPSVLQGQLQQAGLSRAVSFASLGRAAVGR